MKNNLKKNLIRNLLAALKGAIGAADRSFRMSNHIYDRVSAGKEQHLRSAYHLYVHSR